MMYKKRHFLMMSAAMAALSAGGFAATAATAAATAAAAPVEPEYPNDGKIRVRHAETGQVNVFDDEGQLETFGRNIADHADRSNWQIVRPTAPEDAAGEQLASDTAGNNVTVDLGELRAAASGTTTAENPAA